MRCVPLAARGFGPPLPKAMALAHQGLAGDGQGTGAKRNWGGVELRDSLERGEVDHCERAEATAELTLLSNSL